MAYSIASCSTAVVQGWALLIHLTADYHVVPAGRHAPEASSPSAGIADAPHTHGDITHTHAATPEERPPALVPLLDDHLVLYEPTVAGCAQFTPPPRTLDIRSDGLLPLPVELPPPRLLA